MQSSQLPTTHTCPPARSQTPHATRAHAQVNVAVAAALVVSLGALWQWVGRLSERAVTAVCCVLACGMHLLFFVGLFAGGATQWLDGQTMVSRLAVYVTLVVLADFALAPYWFTNVSPAGAAQ
jgi:hypothetical protein